MWVLVAVIVVSIHVYVIIDAIKTFPAHVNVLPKRLWVVVVLVPLIGPALWLMFGQRNAPFSAGGVNYGFRSRSPAPNAPDDDPEFLRILDIKRHQREEAKRLEEWSKDLQRREKELGDDGNQNDNGPAESSVNEE